MLRYFNRFMTGLRSKQMFQPGAELRGHVIRYNGRVCFGASLEET